MSMLVRVEGRHIRPLVDSRTVEINQARDLMRKRGTPQWVRELVSDMSANLRVSPLEVLRDCRFQTVVKARNAILYRIKEAKPKLSSPQIGKWFDRDHTTVLYGIAMHAQSKGIPQLTGYDLDTVRKRRSRAYYRLQPKRAP